MISTVFGDSPEGGGGGGSFVEAARFTNGSNNNKEPLNSDGPKRDNE